MSKLTIETPEFDKIPHTPFIAHIPYIARSSVFNFSKIKPCQKWNLASYIWYVSYKWCMRYFTKIQPPDGSELIKN